MTTTSKRRTDAHAPSNFVPENYTFVGSYDASPSAYMVVEVGQFGQKYVSYLPGYERAKQLEAMVAASSESRSDGRCDHCGATIRYRAVMRHTPTGQVIQVGETCLDNRFSLATAEFKAMKKAAEEARKDQRVKKAVALWVAENPEMGWMASQVETEAKAPGNNFVADVARKLRAYGSISERQVEAVKHSLVKDAEMAAKRARWAAEREAEESARAAEHGTAPVPRGRVTVEGKVLTVREPDPNAQFPAWKMLVQTDQGWKVWGTVPRALDTVDRGDRVSFVAEVQPSDKDPMFGFYSRPMQARFVERAPREGSGK